MQKTTFISCVVSILLLAIYAIGILPLSYCLLIVSVWGIIAWNKMNALSIVFSGLYALMIFAVLNSPFMFDVYTVTHSIDSEFIAELWNFAMVAYMAVFSMALLCCVLFIIGVCLVGFGIITNNCMKVVDRL